MKSDIFNKMDEVDKMKAAFYGPINCYCGIINWLHGVDHI